MPNHAYTQTSSVPCLCLVLATLLSMQSTAEEAPRSVFLEEVIITAQKRAESLQDAPISVSAMDAQTLKKQGLAALTDFQAGAIPALKIAPFPNNPATQVIFVRGVGNSDAEQLTKEMGVGVYLDNIYLGRAQGMAMELADLERIEVLRGPQGTLYGRNALGGAVGMVTKRPTGDFGIDQVFSLGNYGYGKSVTQVDLPQFGDFGTKMSYLNSRKDGWVRNSAQGEEDFAKYGAEGARLAVNWAPADTLSVDYSYDWSEIEATQLYYQVDSSTVPPQAGGLPPEPDRETRTRFAIAPLDSNISEVDGHTLNISWQINFNMELRSITGVRKLDNEVRNNYGGALAFGGLVAAADSEQEQFSQEIQLLGSTFGNRIEYVLGLYWFEEEADEAQINYGSLIAPPALIPYGPPRIVEAEAKSRAAFGQLTYTPEILEERLQFVLGLRYTEDEKEGIKSEGEVNSNFDTNSDNTAPTVTVVYDWTDEISTYLRWANGYRAGGANLRSSTFRPYEEETLESWELGLKSELLERQLRFNAALFKSYYEDRQMDFSDPMDITVSETINADRQIGVEGLELDMTAILSDGLLLGIQWVYMDHEVPRLFNPLSGRREAFTLPMAPQNSGSISLDYTFEPFSFGTLSTNLTWNYSRNYYFSAQNFHRDSDGYQLLNARITLDKVPLGNKGQLQFSLWAKNLSDKEWIIHGIDSVLSSEFGLRQVSKAYGEPRTYGLEVRFKY